MDGGVCSAAHAVSHTLLAPSPPLVQAGMVCSVLRLPVTAHPDCTNERRQRRAERAVPGLAQELTVATRVCRRGKDEA